MDREEARRMLGLEQGTSVGEIEEAYRKKRAEIEARVEGAPTEALKKKYRSALGQLEAAREALQVRPAGRKRAHGTPRSGGRGPDRGDGVSAGPERAHRSGGRREFKKT